MLSQFVTPDRSDSYRQQQPFQSFGMLQTGVVEVKAPRFVIPKALLDGHTQAVFFDALSASRKVGNDRQNLRRVLGVTFCPGDRQVGAQFGFLRQQDVLEVAASSRSYTQLIDAALLAVFQSGAGAIGKPVIVVPAQFQAQRRPVTIPESSVGQKGDLSYKR